MSLLTLEEGRLLRDLTPGNVRTIGRPRIVGLLNIVGRLQQGLADANDQTSAADFLNNGFWLTASGQLTEEMIAAQPRLSPEQKADLLKVVQMRLDADQWREYCGLELPALPSVAASEPVSPDSEIHDAERVG